MCPLRRGNVFINDDGDYECLTCSHILTSSNSEIEKRFTYQKPKGNQADRYSILRDGAKYLATNIDTMCPDSREKSIALTKLEEAIMWANKAIAINE